MWNWKVNIQYRYNMPKSQIRYVGKSKRVKTDSKVSAWVFFKAPAQVGCRAATISSVFPTQNWFWMLNCISSQYLCSMTIKLRFHSLLDRALLCQLESRTKTSHWKKATFHHHLRSFPENDHAIKGMFTLLGHFGSLWPAIVCVVFLTWQTRQFQHRLTLNARSELLFCNIAS